MKAYLADPDANVAVMDAFERTEELRICRWCNFRVVCRPTLAVPVRRVLFPLALGLCAAGLTTSPAPAAITNRGRKLALRVASAQEKAMSQSKYPVGWMKSCSPSSRALRDAVGRGGCC